MHGSNQWRAQFEPCSIRSPIIVELCIYLWCIYDGWNRADWLEKVVNCIYYPMYKSVKRVRNRLAKEVVLLLPIPHTWWWIFEILFQNVVCELPLIRFTKVDRSCLVEELVFSSCDALCHVENVVKSLFFHTNVLNIKTM